MPYQPPSQAAQFRKRLAVYLTGVAIGLLMLGFYWSARSRSVGQPPPAEGQDQQTDQAAPDAASPANDQR